MIESFWTNINASDMGNKEMQQILHEFVVRSKGCLVKATNNNVSQATIIGVVFVCMTIPHDGVISKSIVSAHKDGWPSLGVSNYIIVILEFWTNLITKSLFGQIQKMECCRFLSACCW
mmetsp:Transcript_16734/g.30315  ORF Transcript_16734/g.30315 Transcript_16734/m.30315 type:complete len:118 (+) Transcript_16734:262-615(+)